VRPRTAALLRRSPCGDRSTLDVLEARWVYSLKVIGEEPMQTVCEATEAFT
jgi:hypothetical protein